MRIYTLPVRALGSQAFYKNWQILLDEHADAVHVMGAVSYTHLGASYHAAY